MWGRRLGRLLAWGAVVATVIVWNVEFDRHVRDAGRQYVKLQRLWAAGSGEYTAMDDVMRPAVARGTRSASVRGGLTAAVLVPLALAARRLAA